MDTIKILIKFQKSEITEHNTYKMLAKSAKGINRKVLESISRDELKHYNTLKKHSKLDVKPSLPGIFFYYILSKIFGITFAVKLMERGETSAQQNYSLLKKQIPASELKSIISDELKHEKALIKIIHEEKLSYLSSMVLGLNDALVELTGALAGFTFALQNTKIIGIAGVITGIAASFSMSAAEYLSQKSDKNGQNPLKAAMYTGVMYFVVVLVLVLPYFLMESYYKAFFTSAVLVFFIVFAFSSFVSVIQDKKFRHVFGEMITIVTGVIILSFIIGLAARKTIGIDI
ncbi:MAG: VIT1/CCC1 transporter family protein [Spirochaetes bacterium]|nr:VIT1/CCC1 transporter family protein [Spirochaetota bacterium]